MSNLVPERVPAKRYQWLMVASIRIARNKYHVSFESKADYESLLNDPFELARIALDAGCSEIPIYVRSAVSGTAELMLVLNANSVAKLGQRLDAADIVQK